MEKIIAHHIGQPLEAVSKDLERTRRRSRRPARCDECCSAARWAAAPPPPATMCGGDHDFDEVWAEAALADEIDCACVSHLERTLFVLRAGDRDDGDGWLPPPDLASGLDAVHHR
jgi:hypothetical protein